MPAALTASIPSPPVAMRNLLRRADMDRSAEEAPLTNSPVPGFRRKGVGAREELPATCSETVARLESVRSFYFDRAATPQRPALSLCGSKRSRGARGEVLRQASPGHAAPGSRFTLRRR